MGVAVTALKVSVGLASLTVTPTGSRSSRSNKTDLSA